MLPEKPKQAWSDFYDSARQNEVLPEETTLLLHLASALAVGCDP